MHFYTACYNSKRNEHPGGVSLRFYLSNQQESQRFSPRNNHSQEPQGPVRAAPIFLTSPVCPWDMLIWASATAT